MFETLAYTVINMIGVKIRMMLTKLKTKNHYDLSAQCKEPVGMEHALAYDLKWTNWLKKRGWTQKCSYVIVPIIELRSNENHSPKIMIRRIDH